MRAARTVDALWDEPDAGSEDARDGLIWMTQDEVATRCDQELRQALPHLPSPVWSRVIAEKRATISCTPGLKRPDVKCNGVILAGDYTDPDYPPTLEAAVRSGVRAARLITQEN